MKPGASKLNPYAAAFIPVAKREKSEASPKNGNPSLDSVINSTTELSIDETSAPKTHPSHGQLGDDKHIMDEYDEMQLECLRLSYPGLSNESLVSVYWANNKDLVATIDMLDVLEMPIDESSETLPDTLDFGDASETVSVPSATCGALKLKNVAGEASAASSSGSVESAAAS